MTNSFGKTDDKKDGKTVGIDLGTTNSAIAYIDPNVKIPRMIRNKDGHDTTPSIVSWDKDGKIRVGDAAKSRVGFDGDTTVRSIKRCMGMTECKELPEKIRNMGLIPEQISAIILKKLIRDAETRFGEIKRVVISVPAYFRDGERKATKTAALLTGLKEENIKIVNEPNAAAMSYALDNRHIEKAKILIFDLGGGTFDVTILEMRHGICSVKDNGGERLLGGDDFDKRIVSHLVEEFKNEYRINLEEDDSAMRLIKSAAETAKINLSNDEDTDIILTRICQGIDMNKTLTRVKFDELTKDLVKKTITITEDTLNHANMKPSDIDKIVMVGGSSWIPAVQNAVKGIFKGKDIGEGIYVYEPDLAIAKGAAIYAHIMFKATTEEEREIKQELMGILGSGQTVATHDLGVSAVIDNKEGMFSRIIKKGAALPTMNTEIYNTRYDGQTSISVEVYEGEDDIVKNNKLWGKFSVFGIPPGPAGHEKISITFEYADDNTIRVMAKVLSTGAITEELVCSSISNAEITGRKKTVDKQMKALL